MKPEVGGVVSMAQEEFDPLDLLSKVAMLVLEARTPDHSAKGRVEGPHCPQPAEQKGQHQCSPHLFQCVQAQEVRQRIDVMWRNGIPSCMDILLFPSCLHGRVEAYSLDGAGNEVEENALLLERWSIKCIKKWHGEWMEGVTGSMLLQAVRSYLYFSQLSSWLASKHGVLPGFIAYRLYAPGDCGDVDFTETPLTHKFPSAIYGPHGLKVTVLHLPRLRSVPDLKCALEYATFMDRGSRSKKEENTGAAGGRKKKRTGYAQPKSGYTSPAEGSNKEDEDDTGPCLDALGPLYSETTAASPPFIDPNDKTLEDMERQNFRMPATSDGPSKMKSRVKGDSQKDRTLTVLDAMSKKFQVKDDSRKECTLAVSDAVNNLKSRVKGNSQKEIKAKKSSAREALEGQLRPLELTPPTTPTSTPSLDLHSPKDGVKIVGPDRLRHRLVKSASMMFNARGSLPSQSSPAPIKRRSTGRFDYDETLTTAKAIKNAVSMSRLPDVCKGSTDSLSHTGRVLSTSAPASTNCLLGNFEESILNGRLEPAGVVDGFSIDIGASGEFCPRHVSLPVTAYFFNLSDDNAPSPYLGHINLDGMGKRGYHIPTYGTLQVTLFNPNRTVVKMFVVKYDLKDMPANSQTVLRQRTVYQPVDPHSELPSYLRYLIHLRISSSSSGKTYLHTDIRLIFARHKFELDSSIAQYELRSYTETPVNPKYSPKR